MSVKCFISTCNNPVIGQCSGYKDNCGRFYCSTHSTDTLCADCAKRKVEEEALHAEQVAEEVTLQAILDDYFQAAQQFHNKLQVLGILMFISWGFAIFIMVSTGSVGVRNAGTIPYMIALVFFLGPLIGLFIYNLSRLAKLDKEKPGFKKFFKAWQKEKAKVKNAAFFRTLLGAATVATAIHIQYQRQHLFNDVHEIRRKLDDL